MSALRLIRAFLVGAGVVFLAPFPACLIGGCILTVAFTLTDEVNS